MFWVFWLGIVLSVSHNTASLGAPKTLDRIYEPVVATAGDMQVVDFYGQTVSGFNAFRYDAATFGWEEVPVQVDQTAPTPVAIVGSASGSQGSLGWEWTDDYDLVGYHIYRATQSGGPYTKLTLGGPVEEKDYSVQLVPQGTTYYFVVKAVDEAGLESTVSNEVALTNE